MPNPRPETHVGPPARRLALTLFLLVLAQPALAVDEVHLTTGEVLQGLIVGQQANVVVLQHATFGRLEIPRTQIASIDALHRPMEEPAAESVEDEAEAAQTESVEGTPAGEAAEPPKPWTFNTNLGLSTVSGNTNEKVLQFGWLLRYRSPEIRFRWDGSYYYKESDGSTTDNKLTSGAVHDWLMPETRWFWFIQGRADYDQFESWNQRYAIHGGPGYSLIDRAVMDLDLRLGIGGRKEFGSSNDDLKPEALLGVTFEWRINDRHTVDATMIAFPVLNDFDDWRTRSTANWRMGLARWEHVKLTFNIGLTHEYQSIVDPGNDRNDLRISAGLGFEY